MNRWLSWTVLGGCAAFGIALALAVIHGSAPRRPSPSSRAARSHRDKSNHLASRNSATDARPILSTTGPGASASDLQDTSTRPTGVLSDSTRPPRDPEFRVEVLSPAAVATQPAYAQQGEVAAPAAEAPQDSGDPKLSVSSMLQLFEGLRQAAPAPVSPVPGITPADLLRIVETMSKWAQAQPNTAADPADTSAPAPSASASDAPELPSPSGDAGEEEAGEAAGNPFQIRGRSDATGSSGTPGNTQPKRSITRLPSPDGLGEDRLSMTIQESDLREVLHLLSEQSGKNILASKSVSGTVTATLKDVDVDTALDAILRSTGFAARRDGNFIYVGTPQDFDEVDRALDRISTRVYRPNYTTAKDLQTLLTPLLSKEVGKISVTAPAQVGIATNGTTSGGDAFANGEALVVQDYETVLKQMDEIVGEIDERPLQVAIEAMILSVRLSDEFQFGVNWEFLRQQKTIRFGLGDPVSPLFSASDTNTGGNTSGDSGGSSTSSTGGGLSFAFLDSSVGSFVKALETIGDTNVIATPRLVCLNKQRAEILIGAQLGYVNTTLTETSAAQNVQFLEVGAQLRLRPYISNDGLIRLEVHPELSTGSVRTVGGFTLPDKIVTQVTTNVMTRDGLTVIIGGLMREDLTNSTRQLPLLGNLPLAGGLFRQKTEKTERSEIIILLTPKIIYDPDESYDAEQAAHEFHRRQGVVSDTMSPTGKRLLGRKYFRSAQLAYAQGDCEKALRLAEWAVKFDPQNRAAIDLRSDIQAGRRDGEHSGGAFPPQQPFAPPGDSRQMPDWLLESLEAKGGHSPGRPLHPRDPGMPAMKREIERPRSF